MIIDQGLRLHGNPATPTVGAAITNGVGTNIIDMAQNRDIASANDIYAVFTPTTVPSGLTALTSTIECQVVGSVGPGPYTAPTVAATAVAVNTVNGQALTLTITCPTTNIANGQPIYLSGTITAPVGSLFGGSTGTLQVSCVYYAVVISTPVVGIVLCRTYAAAIAAAAALATGSPFAANSVGTMTSVTTTTPTINQITWLLGTSGTIVAAWNDAMQAAGTAASPFNPGGATGGASGPQIVVDLSSRQTAYPTVNANVAGVTGSPGPMGVRYIWANFVTSGITMSGFGDLVTQDADSRKTYASGFQVA
jgi:hypothetical protein